MKKAYKKTKKSVSYKIAPSKYYSAYALVVDGKEIAWGDKKSMESKKESMIRRRMT